MKKLLCYFLTILMLSSCVTSRVSEKNNYDFTKLKKEKNYNIELTTGEKIKKFWVDRVEENKIIGLVNGKNIAFEKDKILIIKQFDTTKTIILATAVIGTVILGGKLMDLLFKETMTTIITQTVN